MNELGKSTPTIRERRAEIAGEITFLQKRLRQFRESLVHVDATIRLFDPEGDPTKILGRLPYKRVKLFGAGRLKRLILAALRRGERPMTTAEVVASIVANSATGRKRPRA